MGVFVPSTTLVKARFARIVERTQTQLCGFVCGIINDGEDAPDIVQDAYADAWSLARRDVAHFGSESDEADARRWLFHAAYCKAISHLRHRGVITWQSLDEAPLSDVAEQATSGFESHVVEAETLRAALGRLERAEVICLTLKVAQGFSAVEIAQILEITPEATRKRLSRAMQRLRAAYFAGDLTREATSSPHRARPGNKGGEA